MTSVDNVTAVPVQTLALVKRNDGVSYELEKVLLRQLEDDEVLIRCDAVSLCGSDIALYKWNDLAKVGLIKYAEANCA